MYIPPPDSSGRKLRVTGLIRPHIRMLTLPKALLEASSPAKSVILSCRLCYLNLKFIFGYYLCIA